MKCSTSSVTINNVLLTHAVMDYFTDISRLKKFHHINHINETKIVAYEVFWLLKRKPLQVDVEANQVFVNEEFLVLRLLEYISTIAPQIDAYIGTKKLTFLRDTLFYHLQFRDCSPQTLELALICFNAGIICSKNPSH